MHAVPGYRLGPWSLIIMANMTLITNNLYLFIIAFLLFTPHPRWSEYGIEAYDDDGEGRDGDEEWYLSLIHISEPTRPY